MGAEGEAVLAAAPASMLRPDSSDVNLQSSILHPQSSVLHAWFYLVWFCVLRQARARQMVWVAVGLMVLMATVVGLLTLAGRGGMDQWRWNWVASGPQVIGPPVKFG